MRAALRWNDVNLAGGVLAVERAIAQLNGLTWEKDTRTHQHRRIALDLETVALLSEHRQRCGDRTAQLGVELPAEAFVLSPAIDSGIGSGSTPATIKGVISSRSRCGPDGAADRHVDDATAAPACDGSSSPEHPDASSTSTTGDTQAAKDR